MYDLSPSHGLSQGDIVAGLSADGYQDAQTYGIIITARCDLAHEKAPLINYVPVVPVRDWFHRDGWKWVAHDEAEGTAGKFVSKAMKQLRFSEFEELEVKTALENYGASGVLALIRDAGIDPPELVVSLAERLDALQDGLRTGSRPSGLADNLVQNLLNKLQGHAVADLHYLPLDFVEYDHIKAPHVALLRQIYVFSSDCIADTRGGNVELQLMGTRLPPVTAKDFALPFGRVARLRSPNMEHLMQRLTLLFARVGVDDIHISHLKELSEAIR